MAQIAERARGRRDDLQHLAGGYGGERDVAQDDHHGHREERAASSGEARAEARGCAHGGEQYLLAPAATVAMISARVLGDEDVDAGGDDDQGDDHAERPGVDARCDGGAEIAEDQGAGAHRHGDAPVDAAAALVEPGRSEEHTSELQSRLHLVCRLLLEKKKKKHYAYESFEQLYQEWAPS